MSLFWILLWTASAFSMKVTHNNPAFLESYAACTINEEENKALCKGIVSDELGISPYITFEERTSSLRTEIKQLEIRQGHTPKIPAFAIQFTTITHLTIQNMSVKEINSKAFDGLRNMKFIDLSNNELDHLPPDLFKFTGVKHLKLSHNPNLTIPSDVPFIVAPRLFWLSLSGCSINNLPEHVFSDMPALHHLDLSHNKINAIPNNLFKTTSLTFINLSHNNLKTISLTVFQMVPGYPLQPRTVFLKNNPWHCDCELNPVVSWLSQDVETHYPTRDPRRSRLLEHTKCTTPSKFADLSWNHLEMLQCTELGKEIQL